MTAALTLTTAGAAAIADGANLGTAAVRFTRLALGSGTGSGDQSGRVALIEQRDVVVVTGSAATPQRIAIRGDFSPRIAYAVTEVGLFARAGDPFGAEFLAAYWVAADAAGAAAAASPNAALVVAGVVEIQAAAADITVTPGLDIAIGVPPDVIRESDLATVDAPGIVELATDVEAAALAARDRAVHPASLGHVLAGYQTTAGLAAALDDYASRAWVMQQVADLLNGAPEDLDTLNELAEALGDDANLGATLNAAIAQRVRTDALLTTLNTLIGSEDWQMGGASLVDVLLARAGVLPAGYTATEIARDILSEHADITATQTAQALEGAAYTATQTAEALVAVYADITATQTAQALVAVYADITATQTAVALEGAAYTATQTAEALVAVYDDITATQTAQALVAVYADITTTQTAVALEGAAYTATQTAEALVAVYADITATQTAQALVAVYADITATQTAQALVAVYGDITTTQTGEALAATSLGWSGVSADLRDNDFEVPFDPDDNADTVVFGWSVTPAGAITLETLNAPFPATAGMPYPRDDTGFTFSAMQISFLEDVSEGEAETYIRLVAAWDSAP